MPPTELPPLRALPLGAGFADKGPVGNKAGLLDRAARAGLAVPTGVVLPDEATRAYLADGREDPTMFFRLPAFAGPVAVRSAFSAEDTARQSLAGYFESVLWVAPHALHPALTKVLCSAARFEKQQNTPLRHDVLLLEMVPAKKAGVGFLEPAYQDDRINYTTGTADKLVGGQTAGKELELPRLFAGEGQLTGYQPAPWEHRLQRLCRRVRQVFGNQSWDIEWADDGETCWLLQIRPVTRATLRNERFTLANHKEILPPLPSRTMTSLVADCSPRLFAYYRNFDPELPANRPFIEVFHGRPVINLSLLEEMLRKWGLPTRLVSDSIGGSGGHSFGLNPVRIIRHANVLLKQGFSQLRATRTARLNTQKILTLSEEPAQDFPTALEQSRKIYTLLVQTMFDLTAAMSGPLALLRRAGTLAAHHRKLATPGHQMHQQLLRLAEIYRNRPDLQDRIAEHGPGNGSLPSDWQTCWRGFMEEFGHRGVYESDLSRPRSREAPQRVLSQVQQLASRKAPTPLRKHWVNPIKTFLTLPLWWQARGPLLGREVFRHKTMKAFERQRNKLLRRWRQLLPDAHEEQLWKLSTAELAALETGWRPDAAFWEERDNTLAANAAIELPDVFSRFDELDNTGGEAADETRFTGIGLNPGTVTGRAWVCTEPPQALWQPETGEPVILVARSVDAGWVGAFQLADAVAVETGGDLSHGSIILREIGLPACTNLKGIGNVQQGSLIRLNGKRGSVELVEKPSAAIS